LTRLSLHLARCLLAAALALMLTPRSAQAQQRPLATEDPEPIGTGHVLLEGGFDYSTDNVFPVSGLEGNLLRLLDVGVSVGISPIAEFQIDGGFYNHLNITRRTRAPQSSFLRVTGDDTSDFENFVVATKIRLVAESAKHPAFAVRFATKLPNGDKKKGISLDTMDFLATFIGGKTVQSVRLVGNVGVGILSDPVADHQNDVLLYGASFARAITDHAEFVGEINGRWSTRSSPPPAGTESRSLVNLGGRYTIGALRLDGSFFFGLTKFDPSIGVGGGFTYVFNAFQIP